MLFPINLSFLIYLSILWVLYIPSINASLSRSPPSQDPFYTPPSGFENTPPGHILKIRELPQRSLSVYSSSQNIKNAYQLLYRTTNAYDQPTSTVTTVIIPYNFDESKLVSYQVMQNSLSQDCTISYALHTPNRLNLVLAQLEMLAVDSLLRRGWYVCIPDHWGPSSLFASTAMGGHATLDGIRAVLSSGNLTHLRPDARVQMWGYSSGALATSAAVELQPTYAPGLNNSIIGASMGGIPVNINATFAQSSNTIFSELSFVGINSFMLMDKNFEAYIDSILRPEMKDEFYKARQLCFADVAYQFSFRNLTSFFTRSDYANHPVVENMLKANSIGQRATPTIPLFFYHGTNDEVTPFSYVDQLYSKWCDHGANIEMLQDGTFYHVGLYLAGLGDLLQNLERRFKDPHYHSGCSARGMSSLILDHGAFPTFFKALVDAVRGLLGRPLGPKIETR